MDRRLYIKHISVLVSGSALAQLINLASYPIITRIYSPHSFGILTLFISITAIIGSISCLRFEIFVQSSKEYQKISVYKLCLLISVAVAFATTVGVFTYILFIQETSEIYIAPMAGLVVFLSGYVNASSLLLLREEEFRIRSSSFVLRTLLTAVPQVLLFFVFPGAVGLVVGFCVGMLAQALLLGVAVHRRFGSRAVSIRRVRTMFMRFRGQAVINVPSILLSAFSLSAMSLFVAILYNPVVVGLYGLAFRLAALPLSLLANSLSEVFFQRGAKAFRQNGKFWNEMKFSLVTSSAISVAAFLALGLFAEPLLTFYLGREWREVPAFVVYLAPMLALRFVCVATQAMPLIVHRPRWLFLSNVALVAAMVMVFIFAYLVSLDVMTYIIFTSILLSVLYVIIIALMARTAWIRYR